MYPETNSYSYIAPHRYRGGLPSIVPSGILNKAALPSYKKTRC